MVIALDVGTSSARAGLYDAAGRPVADRFHQVPYEPRITADGAFRGLAVQLHATGKRRVGVEVAEQQVGVRHGRLVAASPKSSSSRYSPNEPHRATPSTIAGCSRASHRSFAGQYDECR